MQPLVESNKPLAETIGKVMVHCLYNKSGCQWQGTLSACITHGSTCGYGNSPVVCNRCGARIVHRQVQEHAQLCSVCIPIAVSYHMYVLNCSLSIIPFYLSVDCRVCNLKHNRLMVIRHSHRQQQPRQ
jgi:hypothetical protein